MKFKYLLFIIIVSISCSNIGDNRKKLNREEFKNLLIDLHLTDAIIQAHNTTNPTTVRVNMSQYDSIFIKHNITEMDLYWNIAYYTQLTELDKIYHEIINEFNIRKGKVQIENMRQKAIEDS